MDRFATQTGGVMIFPFYDNAIKALKAAMRVIRSYQLGLKGLGGRAEVKTHDQTLLTQCDKDSDAASKNYLLELPKEFDIQPEDGDGRISPGALYRVWVDNLDGTRAFNIGLMTSTVILAIYEYATKQVVWCAVGEPISGRVWMVNATASGHGARTGLSYLEEGAVVRTEHVYVNKDSLDGQATVFLDLNRGFRRKVGSQLRDVMSTHEVLRLTENITTLGAHISMPGSNGLHQALVANGREGCVGGVTTAMGGPWDTAGALLVLGAEGSARAFSMEPNNTLREQNALDPESYDILVYGNSQLTVDQLVACLPLSIG